MSLSPVLPRNSTLEAWVIEYSLSFRLSIFWESGLIFFKPFYLVSHSDNVLSYYIVVVNR
ncbi:MAG: hypothetical protein PWQ95_2059 [Thermococcaceae archaeon]|nr:hypothetical protein [Thermococcaceae archaeon]